MSPRQHIVAATIAATLASAAPSHAQSGGAVDTSKAVKLVNLDLTVPDSPAFVILGLSPEKVVRPNAPKDLATTLLNGVDRHGNLQSGLAIDFAPLFLFAGNTLEYSDYHDHTGTQILGRTQISFATTKGASEGDKSVRAGFGFRSTLWDRGDPRLDDGLVTCLNAIAVPVPSIALTDSEKRKAWEDEQAKTLRPKVQACHAASAKRLWNASSLAIGIAPAFQSPTGESSDFKYAGAAVWAALALKLSTSGSNFGQFIVQGRYRNKEMVPDKNNKGSFFEQDSSGLGLRLVLGEPVRAVVIESEVGKQSPKNGDATTSFTLSGGGQIKLSDDLWLSAAVGGALKGSVGEQRGLFVLSSFKWALSKEPSIKSAP
jgi:hypothetical protein